MPTTSESLLLKLASPDQDGAWDRFVELYTPLLFFWARRMGLQQQDAADLVQDVLTIVLRHMGDWVYDPKRSFRGWLRKITINRHRELLRRRRTATESHFEIEAVPNEQAESTWDLNYARELVSAAMDRHRSDFAEKTWQALREWVATGAPVSEIAKNLGMSVWTIYAAKNRLLQRLRDELDGLL